MDKSVTSPYEQQPRNHYYQIKRPSPGRIEATEFLKTQFNKVKAKNTQESEINPYLNERLSPSQGTRKSSNENKAAADYKQRFQTLETRQQPQSVRNSVVSPTSSELYSPKIRFTPGNFLNQQNQNPGANTSMEVKENGSIMVASGGPAFSQRKDKKMQSLNDYSGSVDYRSNNTMLTTAANTLTTNTPKYYSDSQQGSKNTVPSNQKFVTSDLYSPKRRSRDTSPLDIVKNQLNSPHAFEPSAPSSGQRGTPTAGTYRYNRNVGINLKNANGSNNSSMNGNLYSSIGNSTITNNSSIRPPQTNNSHRNYEKQNKTMEVADVTQLVTIGDTLANQTTQVTQTLDTKSDFENSRIGNAHNFISGNKERAVTMSPDNKNSSRVEKFKEFKVNDRYFEIKKPSRRDPERHETEPAKRRENNTTTIPTDQSPKPTAKKPQQLQKIEDELDRFVKTEEKLRSGNATPTPSRRREGGTYSSNEKQTPTNNNNTPKQSQPQSNASPNSQQQQQQQQLYTIHDRLITQPTPPNDSRNPIIEHKYRAIDTGETGHTQPTVQTEENERSVHHSNNKEKIKELAKEMFKEQNVEQNRMLAEDSTKDTSYATLTSMFNSREELAGEEYCENVRESFDADKAIRKIVQRHVETASKRINFIKRNFQKKKNNKYMFQFHNE